MSGDPDGQDEIRRERDDLVLGIRVPSGDIATATESWRTAVDRYALRTGMTVDDVLETPFAVVGDLAGIKDRLLSIHERFGISYFTISEDLAWQIAPIISELAD